MIQLQKDSLQKVVHMLHVTHFFLIIFFGPLDGASWWRVCFQRRLLHLVIVFTGYPPQYDTTIDIRGGNICWLLG